MQDSPLVSIITPSFNQAAYLEQALRSVLDQDYARIEYIVVDGGSSDESPRIIERYADQLTWWVSEKDHGQADGANKGFRRASGEIVGWLNSDDLYLPGAVSAAVHAFQQNPQAGMVFSDVESIDGSGERINVMRFGDWGLPDLMSFRIIGQPGVFLRRSVLEQAGYLDESFHFLLDHHLWLRAARIAGLRYVPGQCWAAARFHAAAKNVAQAASFGQEAYRIARWLEENPEYADVFAPIRRQVWAGAHRLNAFYLLDGGFPKEALRAYWKAFRLNPRAVLPDWRRVAFALLSPLGLEGLRRAYLRRRAKRFQQER